MTGFELSEDALDIHKEIHAAIMGVIGPEAETGGCRAFYTGEEWRERGERYGQGALMIVVHDGGDHAPYFNWDYGAYPAMEKMNKTLEKVGVWAEQCTGWYTAIYAKEQA